MKRFSISNMVFGLLVLVLFSCEDLGVEPSIEEKVTPLIITDVDVESDMALMNNNDGNKIVLYLRYYNKKEEKIEVNRNQATLNFDNHNPQIVDIGIQKGENMVNLKNFRAENNYLSEIPEIVLNKGIKRIEVAHNRLKGLPGWWEKGTPSTLKLLDISYNNLTKLPVFKKSNLMLLDISHNKLIGANHKDLINLALQGGATIDLTKTGISCKEIQSYIDYNKKNNIDVIVISDCYK